VSGAANSTIPVTTESGRDVSWEAPEATVVPGSISGLRDDSSGDRRVALLNETRQLAD
jgi:hypothetical protein